MLSQSSALSERAGEFSAPPAARISEWLTKNQFSHYNGDAKFDFLLFSSQSALVWHVVFRQRGPKNISIVRKGIFFHCLVTLRIPLMIKKHRVFLKLQFRAYISQICICRFCLIGDQDHKMIEFSKETTKLKF